MKSLIGIATDSTVSTELTVSLDQGRSYPLHVGTGLLDSPEIWRRSVVSNRAAIVTNPTVADLYLSRVIEALPLTPQIIEIGDGEQFKSLTTYAEIVDQLIDEKQDRTTTIIALGGGVVGDIGGFVAATYLRGVNLIQAPTTLLAQVDSAVGGKTAINRSSGKNLIGAFYQPQSVIIDVDVLRTLPPRIFVEGLAEVIKYGVIYDESFFNWLQANHEPVMERNPDALEYIIRRSCEIKSEVVQIDEREQGLRAILNFGHTFGHAIETLTDYDEYLHGEAVAIGMRMAANLSLRLEMCSSDDAARVEHVLDMYGLDLNMPKLTADEMIGAMKLDKKVQDGKIRVVLMTEIGNVRVVELSDHALLSETIDSKLQGSRTD